MSAETSQRFWLCIIIKKGQVRRDFFFNFLQFRGIQQLCHPILSIYLHPSSGHVIQYLLEA